MNKHIIPFLLLAVCIFPACREDYYEPEHAPAEAISLSVSDAGFPASDGTLSRSYDTDGVTTFERGDTVGLIILDAAGRLLADNVPYTFNGSNWDFCAGNTEGKQRVYFDKEMTKYIVYYPYTKTADKVKSEKELLASETLKWREDQSTEEAYRNSDVLMWTHNGKPLKEITAAMKHVRNSLSLDLTVRYTITLKDDNDKPIVINYHPKRLNGDTITSYFEDFILYMGNKMILDKTYNAQETNDLARIHKENGAYRYILLDGCDSTFYWRYYYKGKSYIGGFKASSADKETRYKREEFLDLGTLSGDNILPGDYYCSKMVNNVLTGYVLPQDALELLPENRCIGIVFKVGQHIKDNLMPYLDQVYVGTDTEDSRQCHGYAIALTNASLTPCVWCSSTYKNTDMNTSNVSNDWNGYYNCQTVINSSKYQSNPADFPAINLCEEYGKSILPSLEAPYNSSGWYLPSSQQGVTARNNYPYLEASFKNIDAINKISKFNYISSDYHIGFYLIGSTSYWTSSEGPSLNNICANTWYYTNTTLDTFSKTASFGVRPILSF